MINIYQASPASKLSKIFDEKLKAHRDVAGSFSIQNKSNTISAGGYLLPEGKQKAYAKYSIGVERNWQDRFNGYVEAGVNSGGRDGYNIRAGFKYALSRKERALNNATYKNNKLNSYSF